MVGSTADAYTGRPMPDRTVIDDPLAPFSPATRAWFSGAFAAPDRRAGRGLGRDLRRPPHAHPRADRVGQDPRRVPLVHRPARVRAAPPGPATPRPLRLAAQGARLRRRAEPPRAARRDRRRGRAARAAGTLDLRGDAHGRHARRRAPAPRLAAPGHPRHHPRVALPAPHERRRARRSAAVEHVIVDEIHAVAGTKRGAHLALSLERLERLDRAAPAAHRPVGDPAAARDDRAFLGGIGPDRSVAIVDAGTRKRLELRVVVPVEDLLAARGAPPARGAAGRCGRRPGGRVSIWPAIHPRILELIRAHRSTIVFCNSRRLAERLAQRLNELAGEELVRAHHGSIAREQRVAIEEALKAGRLPAIVATSSLELGIDMGAVDLVIQVESPAASPAASSASGAPATTVGAESRGVIFPKYRGDLLEAAVVRARMLDGDIEATRPAAEPARRARAADRRDDRRRAARPSTSCSRLVTRAAPFETLTRDAFDGVLAMLAGAYPSDEFAELKAAGRLGPADGHGRGPARRADRRDHERRHDPGPRPVRRVPRRRPGREDAQGRRARRGDGLRDPGRRGHHPRRVELAGRADHAGPGPRVAGAGRARQAAVLARRRRGPADRARPRARRVRPGARGPASSAAEGPAGRARPPRGGSRSTTSRARTSSRTSRTSARRPGRCRPTGGSSSSASATSSATGVSCILSPFGGRVHAPWALAIEAPARASGSGRRCSRSGPTTGSRSGSRRATSTAIEELALPDPDEIEDLVVAAVGGSALFAARFRENAARALLLPRRRPGARTPLWQQRQRVGGPPRGREPLRLVPDPRRDLPRVPRRRLRPAGPARGPRRGRAGGRSPSTRSRRTRSSPFARRSSSTTSPRTCTRATRRWPSAGRRRSRSTATCCASSSARRSCASCSTRPRSPTSSSTLQSLVGCPPRPDGRRAPRPPAPARRPHAGRGRGRAAWTAGPQREAWLVGPRGVAARRAVRVAGEERWIAIEDAARYRDALGASPPPGVPDAFLGARRRPARRPARPVGAHARAVHRRRAGGALGPAASASVEDALERLLEAGTILRGRVPSRRRRARMVRPRGPPPAPPPLACAAPAGGRAGRQAAFARFLPAWQGVAPAAPASRRSAAPSRSSGSPRSSISSPGCRFPASVLERDILPARVPGYHPRLLDELGALGEVAWVGRGSLGRDDGRIALFRPGRDVPLARACAPAVPPRPRRASRPRAAPRRAPRRARPARRLVLPRAPRGRGRRRRPRGARRAVGPRLGGRGHERHVRAAPRAALAPPVEGPARAAPPARRRARAARGRRPLVARRRRAGPRAMRAATARAHATALAPARPARRPHARGRRGRGDRGRVRRPSTRSSARSRRRAASGAATSSTGWGRPVRAAGRGRPAAGRPRAARRRAAVVHLLAAADPANAVRRRARLAAPRRRRPRGRLARAAGAYVVLVDGVPALYVERGGRRSSTLPAFDDPAIALRRAARARRAGRRRPAPRARGRAGRRRAGRELAAPPDPPRGRLRPRLPRARLRAGPGPAPVAMRGTAG